jgi:hypothetical protein
MQASRSLSRVLAPIGIGLLVPLAAGSQPGCKKDEPPPPLPSAAPAAAPTPSAPLVLVPEEVTVDAGVDAGKKKVGGGSGLSVMNCCKALMQNAESAPEPNKTYMKQAGAMCQAMAGQGQGQASILAAISGALRGAGMPAACR